jgi:hypothetical protein
VPQSAVGMALPSATHPPAPLNPYTDAQTPLPVATMLLPLTMTEAVPTPMPAVCAEDRAQPSAVGMALPSATRPLVPLNPYTGVQTALPVTTTLPPLMMTEAVPTPMPVVSVEDLAQHMDVGMALRSATHPPAPLNPYTDAQTPLPVTMTVPPHTMMEAAPMHHGPMTVVVHVSPRSTVQVYVAALRSMTRAATVEEVAPRSSA